ncbi:MAG: hypothetical protein ACLT98_06935 [Eggerthellaceae bacterium]
MPLHPAQPAATTCDGQRMLVSCRPRVDGSWADAVVAGRRGLWRSSQQAVERALARFVERGCAWDHLFSILLGDPDNPRWRGDGHRGDSGILATCWRGSCRTTPCAGCPPRSRRQAQRTLQFVAWRDDPRRMMVSEGLAENFAVACTARRTPVPG